MRVSPSAVVCTALLAAALSLQGCDSPLALAFGEQHKQHQRVSLMQMPPKPLEKDTDPSDLDDDDEDGPLATDEVEKIQQKLRAKHDKNAPTMKDKPTGIDENKWRAFVQMASDREKQQEELQSDYNNMLDMNDPDEVDKAMKTAWTRMDNEDRRMNAGFNAHMRKQPHHPDIALSQISERTTRLSARQHRRHRRMLNRHARSSSDSGSTLERIERTEKEATKALKSSKANEKQETAMSGAIAALMSSKHPTEASMIPAVKAMAVATKAAIGKVQDAEDADF